MVDLKQKETEFKSMSDTANLISEEQSEDTTRAMLMDMKQTKQKLLLISSKASERINALPQLIQQVCFLICITNLHELISRVWRCLTMHPFRLCFLIRLFLFCRLNR